MIVFIWIWSKKNQWWDNGRYKITGEIVSSYPFHKIQDMFYYDTGRVLCKDELQYPSRIEVPIKLHTLEEVIAILDGK